MSLTGTPFVGLTIVLALAAVAVVAMRSPRLSHGVTGALRRFFMLAGTQLCCLVALFAVLNAHFDFWTTWGDMLGTAVHRASTPHGHQHQSALADSSIPTTGPPSTRLGRMVVPNNDHFVRSHQLRRGHGKLEAVTIRGAASGIAANAYVYLPPQYFQPASHNRRFPVAVVLAGYPGDAHNLVSLLDLPRMAANRIVRGRMQPMIFVMMASAVEPPRDTECTDIPGGPQVETYFAQDVPDAIKAAYRTEPQARGWSMMGYSTGGYCALKIAMGHSDRFRTAAALSPYYHALQDFTTGELYGHDKAFRNENDLLWRLQNNPPPPVNMLVTTTKLGDHDFPDTMKFIKMVRAPAHIAYIELPVGGHAYPTWQQELPATLDWLGAHVDSA
jgi:S-formylglutathione hydrolase FrmB